MACSNKKVFSLGLLVTFLLPPAVALAHKNHAHHHEETKVETTPDAEKELADRLAKINESYKRDVKPIFQRSCFACHSQSLNLPWYNALPLVHGLLESDMKEAKEHLDFSKDYPYQGHGSPKEDLEAIADSVRDKSMPPFRYRIMHWNSGLTDRERQAILKWTDEGQKLLIEPPH